MSSRMFNVLFLCTANSARSVLAESLMTHWGQRGLGNARFRGFSAGSFPRGAVQPLALKLLAELDLPTEGLRSKSWDEFAAPGAPVMDFVFTVCDNAAGEVCPIWPGNPVTAHWGVPDPAAVGGTEAVQMQAYRDVLAMLERRIKAFAALPVASLEPLALAARTRAIGEGKDL